MPKERVAQIGNNAHEDFRGFFADFEEARAVEIEALAHSNSSNALKRKSIVPANHWEIYRESLQGLFRQLDLREKTLPICFRSHLASRKPDTEDWKPSIAAIFYYSALCGAIAANSGDSAEVRKFHAIVEKEYPHLYSIVKRDILIAEAICKGE